jgi:rSAM-associated Gly-rich repeat protein
LKATKFTWIGFLATLSTLGIATKTIAHETNSMADNKSQAIETRLSRIAKTLKQQESELLESSNTQLIDEHQIPKEVAGWLKTYRGGFINGRGGGFVNGRRWPDGGGFLNRRWPNGGGFFNRRY